ncbi:transposase family protein [Actinomadura madurae]|nr:transposase family protein [Actinomadura madurae]MCP9955736.1 transposase family protein [Actinomadura madurae]MCP9972467.1 transposase family protein [Actinomadura madurae]MCP9984980.1 transposase family protein [Actinomadura madurae]MCQ0003461.1 transposase family protein [Actinomadura madurae]MCQ0021179.1 transposase family protein [Actinomadura madurae]
MLSSVGRDELRDDHRFIESSCPPRPNHLSGSGLHATRGKHTSLRKGETFTELGAGFGVSTSTAWRYVQRDRRHAGHPRSTSARRWQSGRGRAAVSAGQHVRPAG